MALKAGCRGPRAEAQGCAETTGNGGLGAADRRMVLGMPPGFPCAMNSRFRTGADKGNPTV